MALNMKNLLREYWEKIKILLTENEISIQLRASYQQLDRQTQNYVIIGGFFSTIFILSGLLIFFIFSTISKKNKIEEMKSAITQLQNTSVEIMALQRKIKQKTDQNKTEFESGEGALLERSQQAAMKSLIAKGSLEIKEISDEMVEVNLDKISLKQLVGFIFNVENSPGVVATKLNVDTRDDPKGFLWATLTVEKQDVKTPANTPKFTR